MPFVAFYKYTSKYVNMFIFTLKNFKVKIHGLMCNFRFSLRGKKVVFVGKKKKVIAPAR